MAGLVAIRTSFRPGSNSAILLEAALEGAREAGAKVEVVDLTKRSIAPCRACDACARTGRCRWTVVDLMWEAGRVLVATPVYYMAAPAQLKLLVDRTQCLYHLKYTLKRRLPEDEIARRKGGVIAVSGSRLENAFDGLSLTMRYFFDSLQMTFASRLYAGHVDRPGEIERRPDMLAEARELGRALAAD